MTARNELFAERLEVLKSLHGIIRISSYIAPLYLVNWSFSIDIISFLIVYTNRSPAVDFACQNKSVYGAKKCCDWNTIITEFLDSISPALISPFSNINHALITSISDTTLTAQMFDLLAEGMSNTEYNF